MARCFSKRSIPKIILRYDFSTGSRFALAEIVTDGSAGPLRSCAWAFQHKTDIATIPTMYTAAKEVVRKVSNLKS